MKPTGRVVRAPKETAAWCVPGYEDALDNELKDGDMVIHGREAVLAYLHKEGFKVD